MAEKFDRKKATAVRVSQEEYNIIEKISSSMGMKITEYIRLVSVYCDISISGLNLAIDNISTNVNRDIKIIIRYTEDEFKCAENKAETLNLSFSDYIRNVSMFASIKVHLTNTEAMYRTYKRRD